MNRHWQRRRATWNAETSHPPAWRITPKTWARDLLLTRDFRTACGRTRFENTPGCRASQTHSLSRGAKWLLTEWLGMASQSRWENGLGRRLRGISSEDWIETNRKVSVVMNGLNRGAAPKGLMGPAGRSETFRTSGGGAVRSRMLCSPCGVKCFAPYATRPLPWPLSRWERRKLIRAARSVRKLRTLTATLSQWEREMGRPRSQQSECKLGVSRQESAPSRSG